MKTAVIFGLTLALVYTVSCGLVTPKPEDIYGPLGQDEDTDVQGDDPDYYGNDNEEEPEENTEQKVPSKILSKGGKIESKLGGSVKLPCLVPNPEESVTIWYKNDNIVFQSAIALAAQKNHKRLSDNSLEISNITEIDEAQYKCKLLIDQINDDQIIFNVFVNRPPKIEFLKAKDGVTNLNAGDTLELHCNATGYPTPRITWHKQEGKKETKPVGDEQSSGGTLIVENIKHSEGGRYFCYADNGIKPLGFSHIDITVKHKPHVTIEKYVVNSDTNMDTELKCIVHSSTAGTIVQWKKNGLNIKASDHVLLENKDNDHILILKGLQESDFAVYTCSAKNHLGKSEQNITLVKTPAVLGFVRHTSPTKDVVLTWRVESKSPIVKHELQYRKKGTEEWHTVTPDVTTSEEFDIYTIKYTLKNLESGTYETRARSQNNHGWSDFSNITVFEGEKPAHKHHKKPLKHLKDKNTKEQDSSALNESVGDKTRAIEQNSSNSLLASSLPSLTLVLLFLYNRL